MDPSIEKRIQILKGWIERARIAGNPALERYYLHALEQTENPPEVEVRPSKRVRFDGDPTTKPTRNRSTEPRKVLIQRIRESWMQTYSSPALFPVKSIHQLKKAELEKLWAECGSRGDQTS